MNKYTVIAIDLDEGDTLMCKVTAKDVDEAKEIAMAKFLSSGPGDPEIQYVFDGHLTNLSLVNKEI